MSDDTLSDDLSDELFDLSDELFDLSGVPLASVDGSVSVLDESLSDFEVSLSDLDESLSDFEVSLSDLDELLSDGFAASGFSAEELESELELELSDGASAGSDWISAGRAGISGVTGSALFVTVESSAAVCV